MGTQAVYAPQIQEAMKLANAFANRGQHGGRHSRQPAGVRIFVDRTEVVFTACRARTCFKMPLYGPRSVRDSINCKSGVHE